MYRWLQEPSGRFLYLLAGGGTVALHRKATLPVRALLTMLLLLTGCAPSPIPPVSPASPAVERAIDPEALPNGGAAAVVTPAPNTVETDAAQAVQTPAASKPEGSGGGPRGERQPTPVVPTPAATAAPVTPKVATVDELQIPGVTARAFAVVDGDTGQVLLRHHAGERLPMASLTKVMTALVTIERGNLDDIVEVGSVVSQLGRGSSLMGITPGERLSVRDLLYGLMLPSGNDAALALAQHVSGSPTEFVRLMNQKAEELGLHDTHFANPHGLDSRSGDHYASALDLINLARMAQSNPVFRQISAARSWTARSATRSYSMVNGNLLLRDYAGADGMKIGYTRAAGQTIIGTAVREGRRLFVVALGSTQRAVDAAILLDRGFQPGSGAALAP